MKSLLSVAAVAAAMLLVQGAVAQDAAAPAAQAVAPAASTAAAPEADVPKAMVKQEGTDTAAKATNPDMEPIATPAIRKTTTKKILSDDALKGKSTDEEKPVVKSKSSDSVEKAEKSEKSTNSTAEKSSTKSKTTVKKTTAKKSLPDQPQAPQMPYAAMAQPTYAPGMIAPPAQAGANSPFGNRATAPKFKLRKFQGNKEVTDQQAPMMQYPAGYPVQPGMQPQYAPQQQPLVY